MTVADYAGGEPAFITDPRELSSTMAAVTNAVASMLEDGGAELRIKAVDIRTSKQNNLMWGALGDVAKHVDWHGFRLSSEEWKDVLTASLKRQRVVPGIEGGFVVLGGRTSKMSKALFSQLVEVIHAFGATQGVQWSDQNWLSLWKAEQMRGRA